MKQCAVPKRGAGSPEPAASLRKTARKPTRKALYPVQSHAPMDSRGPRTLAASHPNPARTGKAATPRPQPIISNRESIRPTSNRESAGSGLSIVSAIAEESIQPGEEVTTLHSNRENNASFQERAPASVAAEPRRHGSSPRIYAGEECFSAPKKRRLALRALALAPHKGRGSPPATGPHPPTRRRITKPPPATSPEKRRSKRNRDPQLLLRLKKISVVYFVQLTGNFNRTMSRLRRSQGESKSK